MRDKIGHCLIALLLLSGAAGAAPAPFFRPPGRGPVTAAELVGAWGAHHCTMELWRDGAYRCDLSPGYTGSWYVQGNRLWITESTDPGVATSWWSYAVQLERQGQGSFRGPVVSGASGTSVGLKKLPAVKKRLPPDVVR